MPRCKHCKDKFEVKYFLQKYCLEKDECIKAHSEYAKSQFEKQKNKVRKAEKRQLRKQLETVTDVKKKCQEVFNEYIRLKYHGQPCYTCGSTTAKMTCGHCYPAGSYGNIRFDEDNCRLQCWYNCNSSKSGNLSVFIPKLQKELGPKKWADLDDRSRKVKKWEKAELREKIKEYRAKVKALKLDKTSNN
jgi:hypothetical protein